MAGAAASTVMAVQSANKQAKQANAIAANDVEAINADRQRAMLAASTAEADRLRELDSVLSTQRAIIGASGVDATSPTGQQIAQTSRDAAQRDINAIRANEGQQLKRDDIQQQSVRLQLTSTQDRIQSQKIASLIQGATNFMSGASQVYGGVTGMNEDAAIKAKRR